MYTYPVTGSPYTDAFNSSMLFIDPDVMDFKSISGGTGYTGSDAYNMALKMHAQYSAQINDTEEVPDDNGNDGVEVTFFFRIME